MLALAGVEIAGIVATAAVSAPPPWAHNHPATSTATVTQPGVTQTSTTITVPAPVMNVAPPVVTVIVPPSTQPTRVVVKTKIKRVRRYCTRQRHGWRCTARRPR